MAQTRCAVKIPNPLMEKLRTFAKSNNLTIIGAISVLLTYWNDNHLTFSDNVKYNNIRNFDN